MQRITVQSAQGQQICRLLMLTINTRDGVPQLRDRMVVGVSTRMCQTIFRPYLQCGLQRWLLQVRILVKQQLRPSETYSLCSRETWKQCQSTHKSSNTRKMWLRPCSGNREGERQAQIDSLFSARTSRRASSRVEYKGG